MKIARFIREVRQETRRVTWPSRKETGISTIMVLFMVSLSATFFFFVDWILHKAISLILGM